MRNEYETKINEFNEDMSFLKRQLKQKENELVASRKLLAQNESADLIQELTEKNQKLRNQLKAVRNVFSLLIYYEYRI